MRRSPARRAAFALAPAAVILMLAGCAESPVASTTAEATPHAELSGEALFRGLFFGEGPAAAALPELWESAHLLRARSDRTPEARAQETAMSAHIIESIRGANPSFFDDFQGAITSGNHVAIRGTMSEAGTLIRDALSAHPDPAVRAAVSGSTAASIVDPEPGWLLIGVVIAVAVAIYLAAYTWDNWPRTEIAPNNLPSLKNDQIVHMIATRLHVAPTH